MAVGVVILYRASGVINLAQGAIGALAAIITWQFVAWEYPLWMGIVTGVVAATLTSIAYGRFVAFRLAHADPIIRAVATLGLALVVLGAVNLIWGEWARMLRLPTDSYGFVILDVRVTYTRAIALALSLAFTIGMIVFLNRSRLGLAMRALASRREISALLGIPTLRVDTWAWAISGVIAGVSGVLLANLTRMQPQFLTFMIIPAIAAAIAGRMQSLVIAVAGGLTIGVIEACATPFVAIASYRTLTPFVFAIFALLWLQRFGPVLISSSALGEVTQKISDNPQEQSGRRLMTSIGLAVVAAVALSFVVPALVNDYWLRTLTSAVIVALVALATAIIYAQLGMVSLCQYALVGVGGWFMLRLWYATHVPFEVSLLCGGVGAALFGLIFGLPALRMRGLYLALTTLMIAGGFQVTINAVGFPDGGPGLLGVTITGPRSYMDRPWLAPSDADYFRYCVAALFVGYLIVLWHKRSKVGRAWAMIRRSEACALAASVNIVKYKVWAFTLAGFLTGIAGGLQAGLVGQLNADSFHANESILTFAVTVIGGAFSTIGPVLAGLLSRAMPGLLNDLHIDGNIASIIFGAGLLHALITAPHGVAGQLADLGDKLKSLVSAKRVGEVL